MCSLLHCHLRAFSLFPSLYLMAAFLLLQLLSVSSGRAGESGENAFFNYNIMLTIVSTAFDGRRRTPCAASLLLVLLARRYCSPPLASPPAADAAAAVAAAVAAVAAVITVFPVSRVHSLPLFLSLSLSLFTPNNHAVLLSSFLSLPSC